MQAAYQVLKETFGYSEFRHQQADIIANVLAGQDTLAIMPTGGGKSLCYQIPALVNNGLTIVVSPLISLMQDQVQQLAEVGVNACMLNSGLSTENWHRNVSMIRSGQCKMLFLAPETLLQSHTRELLSDVYVSLLAIDEAHCISEWGHEFRPEYRQITEVRNWFQSAPVIALTATATPQVRQDICGQLGMGQSGQFVATFNRTNLYLEVKPKNNGTKQCLDIIEQHAGASGIIYCQSRGQVDKLSEFLQRKGVNAVAYHAGLSNQQREENQTRFVRDDIQIVVATIAFGMGINKPDVRFVIHHDLPKNIESYYQQIGRAGRDGDPAKCYLLFSYGDTSKIRYFIDQQTNENERRLANMHLSHMLAFAESDVCRRIPLLRYFGEQPETERCGQCDVCCGEPVEKQDLSVLAQKFMSCILRTGSRFGASHIVDVLRGSNAEKVLQFQHNLLSTYNIGKELSKKQWLALSRQMLQRGLLQQESHGGLKLTAEGGQVLKGKVPFLAVLAEEKSASGAQKVGGKRDVQLPDNVHHELFETLRTLRKTEADNNGVPPFVVFSDRSLREMASLLPQTVESFGKINGVGQAKIEKYASLFLAPIVEFCQQKGLSEHDTLSQLPEAKISKTNTNGISGRTYEIADRFNSGDSVQHIAFKEKIKEKTVWSHLYNALKAGELKIDKTAIGNEITCNAELTQKALNAYNQHGTERMKPVFEELDGAVSYDELEKLRVLFMLESTE